MNDGYFGALYTYPIYFVIFKSSLWVAGFLFVAYLVNMKFKRFKGESIRLTIYICIIMFFISAAAIPGIPTPMNSRDHDYEWGVDLIVNNFNNTMLAYKAFQNVPIYDEMAHKIQWCLPDYYNLTEYVDYYTGPIEDNIRALESTLNKVKINEIVGSDDSVTSVSYLYKFINQDVLVIDTYSDGSIFISRNAGFDWINDRTGYSREDRGDPLYYKYISTDLYRDLLDAIINTDPELLPDSQPLDCEGSLEYVNVTIDGVSFSTYGYRKVDENSIFGATIEDAILQILDQADEGENQISYEEYGESIVPKHEEVGNTSLTNYRWIYYYYH